MMKSETWKDRIFSIHSFSRQVLVLWILVTATSCRTFSTLEKPYSASFPKSLKQGDEVWIKMANGNLIESIRVREVWPDSILVGNDTRALRAEDIERIRVKETDPVATGLGIVVGAIAAVAILFLLFPPSISVM